MNVKNGLILFGIVTAMLLMMARSSSQGTENDIKVFVRAQYHHGIPYEQVTKFDNSVVPILLNMLKDSREQEWRDNIVSVLGIIGDERAVAPLINSLERDTQGEVTPKLLSALLSVPTALGHIAAKGSSQALSYLIAGAKLETWQAKKISWKFGAISGERLHTPLMKAAIMGLGISAQPQAVQTLTQMQANTNTPEGVKAAVSEALALADEIKAKGRTAVFRHHN